MSKNPLEVDGLKVIIVFTGLWVVALVAELIGLINWNQDILSSGVLIGLLMISFLVRRRYRRRRH